MASFISNLFEFFAKTDSSNFPAQLRIENTNLCNAHCVMCPREKMTWAQGIMSFESFQRLADECSGFGPLEMHFHGFGEPLLDKSLPQKIAYAKRITSWFPDFSPVMGKAVRPEVQFGF